MQNSAGGDSSTGSELKAVEEICRESSRTVEPCELCVSLLNPFRKRRTRLFSDKLFEQRVDNLVLADLSP